MLRFTDEKSNVVGMLCFSSSESANQPVRVDSGDGGVRPTGRGVGQVDPGAVGRLEGAGHVSEGLGHGRSVDGQVTVQVDGDA